MLKYKVFLKKSKPTDNINYVVNEPSLEGIAQVVDGTNDNGQHKDGTDRFNFISSLWQFLTSFCQRLLK
jgi:hypothetical protein